MPFRLIVSGKQALFPRPEIRRDLVSYDMLTPLAARGILDAVHWRPAIHWRVNQITILSPIQWSISDTVFPRCLTLNDVSYLLEVDFVMTDLAGPDDRAGQHAAMFRRRIAKRRFDRPVYLGLRDYPADVQLLGDDEPRPLSGFVTGRVDLGWLVHDVSPDGGLRFFRAVAEDGVVNIPAVGSDVLFG